MKFPILLFISFTYAFSQNCNQYKKEISKYKSCSNKNIHLTFDDGPNTTTTPRIVETLKRQKVDATFFISTHQLTKGDLKKKKVIIQDMLQHNFTLASHGHDHNCHDIRYDWKGNLEEGYTDSQRREQVSKSIDLLDKFSNNDFSKQKNTLIRFPYGRGISPSKKEIQKMIEQGRNIKGTTYSEQLNYYRNHSPAMSIASEYKLSHIGWNHDSKDASTTYSAKNKDKYIADQLNTICKSRAKNIMTLFHDTRAINSLPSKYDSKKTVMDELIEKAKCLDINFLSMDEILQKKLQNGVHTKSYDAIERVQSMLDGIDELKSPKTINTCNIKENEMPHYKSCYSKYIGEVKHCDGVESFCINGKWVKNKNIFKSTCEGKLYPDAAIDLSRNYLNKKCSIASKKKVLQDSVLSCYCQYNESEELKWNCFDITKSTPKKYN